MSWGTVYFIIAKILIYLKKHSQPVIGSMHTQKCVLKTNVWIFQSKRMYRICPIHGTFKFQESALTIIRSKHACTVVKNCISVKATKYKYNTPKQELLWLYCSMKSIDWTITSYKLLSFIHIITTQLM